MRKSDGLRQLLSGNRLVRAALILTIAVAGILLIMVLALLLFPSSLSDAIPMTISSSPSLPPATTAAPALAPTPSGSPLPETPQSKVMTRLNMKSYGRHTPAYDARIINIRPEYVIDNPPHGLWGEVFGYSNDELLHDINAYKAAGIKVIGYITAGYAGKGSEGGLDRYWYTLDINKKFIQNMALLDEVDGVFIDECTSFPDAEEKLYLKELTGLARSYGLITWGNVGVDDFDAWYFTEGGFDLMQSTEDWRGQELTPVQQAYGSRISVTGFSPLYTVEDALRLTLDAWRKGIGYCYINTAEYDSIAPWFEEYATGLRNYQ